jgi:hypothetical protein
VARFFWGAGGSGKYKFDCNITVKLIISGGWVCAVTDVKNVVTKTTASLSNTSGLFTAQHGG